METNNISTVNTYSAHNIYAENMRGKNPVHEDRATASSEVPDTGDRFKKRPAQATSSNDSALLENTHISFSVEGDLNVVITIVQDNNTKKVLRQIPSEDDIRRMKILKIHHELLINKSHL